MTIAGLSAAILLAVLSVFQVALAAGAPLGAAAWGGQNPGVLPGRLRAASAFVGLVVYPIIAAVILGAAGLMGDDWIPFDTTIATWALAGFFALGVLANAISRSPPERIWAVVSGGVALCCVVITLS